MKRRTFIIAEAGVNHNGDISIAKRLIDVAVDAQVDAVKFQTFKSEKLVNRDAKKAEYQKSATSSEESQFDMLKKLELDKETHKILIEYCKHKNIMFLSTAFDLESIDLLNDLNMPIFKIPSGEITNYPYLRKIGFLHKKVILSSGMSTIDEIEDAINVLKENGTNDISVLHCNTEYPTPMEDVNLNAMNTIKNELNVEVGYSDHTLGIEVPIAAVAMGASIIEKHFTLDKNMIGPDHKASLDPEELKKMVEGIRNIESALGSSNKSISKSESKNLNIVRKSIVANKSIKKGEIFTEENLTCKRPGNGISPMRWNEVLGQKAIKDFQEDEMIKL
ncbi:MAG: N-acetylneuraminate synthase [Clostridium beijerinckii]|nr:N-acetylneuraminate synthase [Clostridium beijerinckii]